MREREREGESEQKKVIKWYVQRDIHTDKGWAVVMIMVAVVVVQFHRKSICIISRR